MKTVLSGIQPSGNLHIGNYIGALSQWVKMQDDYDCITMLADLHALTLPQDPKFLPEKTKETVAVFLASGIDPDKSHIFLQSQNPDHPYLAWIFQTITTVGQLERMTQYKDKFAKSEVQDAGLLTYPTLMAADILLYDADEVPVGEDQKQHLELTRDIAERFNKLYGETFKIPAPRISKEAARIMSLQNPDRKMSKSDVDLLGTINVLDEEKQIREKVKKAVTDSGSKVGEGGSAAITNLLTIYGAIKSTSFEESMRDNDGKSYSEFKDDLANLLVEKLTPIREKYQELRKNDDYLDQVLSQGLNYAMQKSNNKVREVREKMGLL